MAFKEQGHRSIEAVAYQRLLELQAVPDGPAHPGRDVLATLIRAGMLRGRIPAVRPKGLGTPPPLYLPVADGEENVDGVWLGSHLPDHSFANQLESYGQCFHFQARAEDVYGSPDTDAIPDRLVREAYTRCMNLLDILVRGIIFDPARSRQRGADVYTMIHIIEDSFSDAHAARTVHDWKIAYLKPWRLRSWIPYVLFFHTSGLKYHVGESHHGAISDERDFGYLRDTPGCRAQDSKLVERGCLSERGLKAADAVAELLILLARHAECHERAGDQRRACPGLDKDWNAYKKAYFEHEDPEISAVFSDGDLDKGVAHADLIGPSDTLDRPSAPNLGLGLATDLGDSAESLWLTGDIFITRDPMKAHELQISDLLSHSLQVRLPLKTFDGQRPAGAAFETGFRLPYDLLSGLFSQGTGSLYLGVRARTVLMASRASSEQTRVIWQFGFGGISLDLVLFRYLWLGLEGPRKLYGVDTLGPERWSPTSWTVKAGVAVNVL